MLTQIQQMEIAVFVKVEETGETIREIAWQKATPAALMAASDHCLTGHTKKFIVLFKAVKIDEIVVYEEQARLLIEQARAKAEDDRARKELLKFFPDRLFIYPL